jgi:hypothetical protein
MKHFMLTAIVGLTLAGSSIAQVISPQAKLLIGYYKIRDALVSGSAAKTSTGANEFIQAANSIDYKLISEGNINALLKDATLIAESKDIKLQRTRFANLSDNMTLIARSVRLSNAPIYLQYCPMKKAGWLSSEQAIRNPYYGNAMLTCGEVTETIGQ